MEYKVSELTDKAGVTKRTIHYYISKGLLLPPKGSGVNSLYNNEHLERILLIKKLQAEYIPLNKIREYILENPTGKVIKKTKEIKTKLSNKERQEIYIIENVCNVFEIHYSEENAEKYKYIIENVRKYVENNVNKSRIFPFGIDTNINASFIKQVSKTGNGKAELIQTKEKIDDKIIRTFERI